MDPDSIRVKFDLADLGGAYDLSVEELELWLNKQRVGFSWLNDSETRKENPTVAQRIWNAVDGAVTNSLNHLSAAIQGGSDPTAIERTGKAIEREFRQAKLFVRFSARGQFLERLRDTAGGQVALGAAAFLSERFGQMVPLGRAGGHACVRIRAGNR